MNLAVKLAPIALVCLTIAACNRNTGSVPEVEHPESAFRLNLTTLATADVPVPAGAVLFYGARPAAGGPPVYVARSQDPRFPSTYYLTSENRMQMSAAPVGNAPLTIFARLDTDGNATSITPGDWIVESAEPVAPGNASVTLVLKPLASAAPAAPAFKMVVDIDGTGAPQNATTFILLRQKGGRIPLAAMKTIISDYPTMVTLSDEHLMGAQVPDLSQLEVIVKVDQDGNPQTTVAGDFYGVADAAERVAVTLLPDERVAAAQ